MDGAVHIPSGLSLSHLPLREEQEEAGSNSPDFRVLLWYPLRARDRSPAQARGEQQRHLHLEESVALRMNGQSLEVLVRGPVCQGPQPATSPRCWTGRPSP